MAAALLALAALPTAAQSGPRTLTGTVTDAEGIPLVGATVQVLQTRTGAATDAEGRFRIAELPADTLRLAVSFVGFESAFPVADLRSQDGRIDVRLGEVAVGLDDVVVEERRVTLGDAARSVGVVDAEELTERRGQTLAESLEGLAGVTTLSTGPSIAKPVVRGLHSERILVRNGGVTQEGQQWGAEHAPEIDPFSPERIEVIRGAAGVQYGVGAIGGVIRIEPPPLPHAAGLDGRLDLQGFSNNGQGAGSLMVEGSPAAVPGLGLRSRLSYRRAGDARTPEYVLRNTAFEEMNGAATVGYVAGPMHAELALSRFQTTLGIYRGAHFGNRTNLEAIIDRGGPDPDWDYQFSYDIDTPRQEITHDVAALHGTWDAAPGQWEVTASVQRNQRQEFDAHGRGANDGKPGFDLTLTTQQVEASLRHRALSWLPGGLHTGRVGVSGMHQVNANRAPGQLIPNFRALTGGVFAYETWEAAPAWTLEAGARLDARWLRAWPEDRTTAGTDYAREVRTYASPTLALGAQWRFRESWSLGANLGSAWRPPGVNELYAFGVHHGTATFERGNRALTPERSLDASFTLRHDGARVSGEVSAFHNLISDYHYLRPDTAFVVTIRGTFPGFDYAQTDARLAGFDGALSVAATRWLDLDGTFSLVRGQNLDADGALFGMPADRAQLSARLHRERFAGLREPFAEVTTTLVRRQDRVAPDAQEFAPPPAGYALVGLDFGGTLPTLGQDARLTLSVRNLLDLRYRDYLSRFRYFADEPGRSVVLRLSVPLGRAH